MGVGCGFQEVERGKGMSSSDKTGLVHLVRVAGLLTNHGYRVAWS